MNQPPSDYPLLVCDGCGAISSRHRAANRPCVSCAMIADAVAAERERCAKIVETHHCDRPAGAPLSYDCPCEFKIAAKIRSGE